MTTNNTPDSNGKDLEKTLGDIAEKGGRLFGQVFGAVAKATAKGAAAGATTTASELGKSAYEGLKGATRRINEQLQTHPYTADVTETVKGVTKEFTEVMRNDVIPVLREQGKDATIVARQTVERAIGIAQALPDVMANTDTMSDAFEAMTQKERESARAYAARFATGMYERITSNDRPGVEKLVREYKVGTFNPISTINEHASTERAILAANIYLGETKSLAEKGGAIFSTSSDANSAVGVALYAQGEQALATKYLANAQRVAQANGSKLPLKAAQLSSAIAWESGNRDLAFHTTLLEPHLANESVAVQLGEIEMHVGAYEQAEKRFETLCANAKDETVRNFSCTRYVLASIAKEHDSEKLDKIKEIANPVAPTATIEDALAMIVPGYTRA